MKRNLLMLALPAAIATTLLLGCNTGKITARTDPTAPSIVQVSQGFDTLGRKWQSDTITDSSSMTIRFSGTITDIDYKNRELTIKDAQGQPTTFSVGKGVQRFNEAKVGDKVSIDYQIGSTVEVRQPTAEETQNPLVVTDTTARAGADSAPAGTAQREIRAVVTIEGMDREAQTVTVKGPRGKHFVTHVSDPSNFDRVRIGDTIVMTFTEATAVSLKPASNYAAN